MAVYVVSDIHGESDRFKEMLRVIDFSKKDTMYIIGDVVDRGPGGIELLRLIKNERNMVFLTGNHEFMMERYFAADGTKEERARWNGKGNEPTLRRYRRLKARKQKELLRFIRRSPSHAEIRVKGRSFYLVHGFPHLIKEEEVWGRPDYCTTSQLTDSCVIVGHTPVCCVGRNNWELKSYLKRLDAEGEKLSILHAPGYIDIDCGCGHNISSRRLACLRLDDMAEFYV